MILVVEASMASKWFLNFREPEDHCQRALEILARIGDGGVRMVLPPRFLPEMGPVLAREKPASAIPGSRDLMAVKLEPVEEPAVFETACELAIRIGQHLFDTLHHAVAPHPPGTTLVTAAKRYHRKARDAGRIAPLGDLVL